MTQREELLANKIESNSRRTDGKWVDAWVFSGDECKIMVQALRAAARPVEPVASRLEQIIEETGSKDAEDLADMANVGHSLMRAINTVVTSEGPFKGWSPAEDPAEIVLDLVNALDEAVATPPPRDWNAAIEAAAKAVKAELNETADYWATTFGGLSSGESVSEYISQHLLPDVLERLSALSSPSVAQGADGELAADETKMDTCQCPKCGRMHRLMKFGPPPKSIMEQIADDIRAGVFPKRSAEPAAPSPVPGSGGGEEP